MFYTIWGTLNRRVLTQPSNTREKGSCFRERPSNGMGRKWGGVLMGCRKGGLGVQSLWGLGGWKEASHEKDRIIVSCNLIVQEKPALNGKSQYSPPQIPQSQKKKTGKGSFSKLILTTTQTNTQQKNTRNNAPALLLPSPNETPVTFARISSRLHSL